MVDVGARQRQINGWWAPPGGYCAVA
jgi:hypothetical protein